MAKIIKSKADSQTAVLPYSALRTILLGLLIGLIYWLLCLIMDKFNNPTISINSLSSVIITIIAVIFMVCLKMAQPLFISVSVCMSLWGLYGWVDGLSIFEKSIFDVILYVLAFSLFTWISRIKKPIISILTVTIIVIIIRLLLTL